MRASPAVQRERVPCAARGSHVCRRSAPRPTAQPTLAAVWLRRYYDRPRRSEIARHGAAFGGCAGGVVGHHPAALPVAGEHHVGGRSAAGGELGRQSDPSGVGGYAALEAGGLGHGRKPQPHRLRRERDHATLWRCGGATRGRRARRHKCGERPGRCPVQVWNPVLVRRCDRCRCGSGRLWDSRNQASHEPGTVQACPVPPSTAS